MQTFESKYDHLLTIAKRMVKEKNSGLDPDEVLSEAYMRLHDKSFNFQQYTNTFIKIIHDEKQRGLAFGSIDNPGRSFLIDKEKVCPCCKELLPIAAFCISTRGSASPIQLPSSWCNECKNKKKRERNRTGPMRPVKRKSNLRWDDYMTEQMQKARQLIDSIRKTA